MEGKEPEVIRCPVDINGFEYEIREASRCVKLGRTDSDRYTPQDSLALTRLMYRHPHELGHEVCGRGVSTHPAAKGFFCVRRLWHTESDNSEFEVEIWHQARNT